MEENHEGKIMTMRETDEMRAVEMVENRSRIMMRMRAGSVTRTDLENTYRAQNYNNTMLFDVLSIGAKDLFDDFKAGGRGYIPVALPRIKDYMHKMERCRADYEQFRRTMYGSEKNVYERMTDLYYEAVVRPLTLMEINVKQQLDKAGYTHSLYLSKLETLRHVSMLGVGITWAIEDLSYCAMNGPKGSLVGGPHSRVHDKCNMKGIQHWIVALEGQLDILPVKASADVEASFRQIEKAIISSDLAMNCAVIIADEMNWEGLPKWFPVLIRPDEKTRKDFGFRTREEIEE